MALARGHERRPAAARVLMNLHEALRVDPGPASPGPASPATGGRVVDSTAMP